LDEKYAPLIVKAFEMKAYDKLSDVEVRERLIVWGWEKFREIRFGTPKVPNVELFNSFAAN
jgi:hypothetical protein